jgi:hypothetical protein
MKEVGGLEVQNKESTFDENPELAKNIMKQKVEEAKMPTGT